MSDTASFRPNLVPELVVRDLAASLLFWVGLLGFRIAYERPEHGFAFLERDNVAFMLEQRDRADRIWETGPLDPPLGRGVNFEITIGAIEPVLDRLAAAGRPLFMAPEIKWYRRDATEIGVRQFLVQDPDGYLLRFAELMGERPAV